MRTKTGSVAWVSNIICDGLRLFEYVCWFPLQQNAHKPLSGYLLVHFAGIWHGPDSTACRDSHTAGVRHRVPVSPEGYPVIGAVHTTAFQLQKNRSTMKNSNTYADKVTKIMKVITANMVVIAVPILLWPRHGERIWLPYVNRGCKDKHVMLYSPTGCSNVMQRCIQIKQIMWDSSQYTYIHLQFIHSLLIFCVIGVAADHFSETILDNTCDLNGRQNVETKLNHGLCCDMYITAIHTTHGNVTHFTPEDVSSYGCCNLNDDDQTDEDRELGRKNEMKDV